jgi:prepilin-type N-terminal cleavage/methylation domain-containing protein
MRRGFTLIELFLVVVILGIISVTGAIAFFSFRGQHLNAAAERVAADLRFARALSLSSNKWIGVAFFVAPVNSYFLYETDGTTDTPLSDPAGSGGNYLVTLANHYENVVLFSVDIAAGTKVEFSPLGTPYQDKAGSPLATAAVITLANDNAQTTVRIEPETGRVVRP